MQKEIDVLLSQCQNADEGRSNAIIQVTELTSRVHDLQNQLRESQQKVCCKSSHASRRVSSVLHQVDGVMAEITRIQQHTSDLEQERASLRESVKLAEDNAKSAHTEVCYKPSHSYILID